ncbi:MULTISPECIES: hypothetical protein [unclassified Agromyces]|uniref:hypothetical protein n=1 Tax=unclassified Agromyces TaxID=2639701 RepID=UPI003014A2CD
MRASPRRRRTAAAATAAALSIGLLAGCTGTPVDEFVDRGVEDAVEGATGGDVSLGGELPADFPPSVPVIDGEVELSGGSGGGEGWVVVLTTSAEDPLGEAKAALEQAGFTEQTGASTQAAAGVLYSDGEHLVVLAGEGTTVSYAVSAAP